MRRLASSVRRRAPRSCTPARPVPEQEAVEVGEPVGLWYRVRGQRPGREHADLSRICAEGLAEFSPISPLYGPESRHQPVPLFAY